MEIITLVLNFLVSIYLYVFGPDKIPTHFGISGTPDRYGDKLPSILILPVVSLLVTFLLPRIKSQYSFKKIIVLSNILFLMVNLMIALFTFGYIENVNRYFMIVFGVFVFLLGGLFPEIPLNRHAGIRVPWTLNSSENWKRTHKFGGLVFKIVGIVMFLMGVFNFMNQSILLTSIFTLIVVPITYSYYLHRKGI